MVAYVVDIPPLVLLASQIVPSPLRCLGAAAARPPCSPGGAAVESLAAGAAGKASGVPQRS